MSEPVWGFFVCEKCLRLYRQEDGALVEKMQTVTIENATGEGVCRTCVSEIVADYKDVGGYIEKYGLRDNPC